MKLRWQNHSEPSEWVNYWSVWLTCTIENKPSLDNNQHFLSPWINAPQIAAFAVFVIRTPGQRCRATHQCCSLGTEWLWRAGLTHVPYPRVLLHSNSRVGWGWGESVSVTRLWDTLNPVTAHPRNWQLRCAAAVVFLLNTIGSWCNFKQSHPLDSCMAWSTDDAGCVPRWIWIACCPLFQGLFQKKEKRWRIFYLRRKHDYSNKPQIIQK